MKAPLVPCWLFEYYKRKGHWDSKLGHTNRMSTKIRSLILQIFCENFNVIKIMFLKVLQLI
jgi:hypothetical protein